MEVKVRCCSLTKPAADGSIIGETCAQNYLQSKEYQLSIDGKLTLGYLTHRGRNLECLPSNVNSPKLKTCIGKDDSGLIVAEGVPTYTHYVKEFFIENVEGEGPWLSARVVIFDEKDFDGLAAANIKRLKALIRAGVKLTCSLVVLAFWDSTSSGVDICRAIKSIKSLDWTVNPSFGPLARITEVIDDEDLQKEFSEIENDTTFIKSQPKEGEIKVKVFSDLSEFGSDLPKSSKINGVFTKLKAKQFSTVCSIVEEVSSEVSSVEEKSFSIVDIKERLREAKLSPRMRFRKLYINYKQVVRQMGGIEKIDENTLKILKSLFTTDVLTIIKEITPLVLQGKQINALIGASSLGKGPRQAAQTLQIPFRMAMKEAQKMGYLTKMRYEKLQSSYMEFVNALIDDVFGNNSSIPTDIDIEDEENSNNE